MSASPIAPGSVQTHGLGAGTPLISVVVPCYNAKRYIGATLRSIIDQAWDALEIVVVDDGSTDGSPEFVEQEFPAVRVIRQANAGVAAARNHGIQAARGEWIAFLDADDIWLPGKLHAQWALIAANPDSRLCYTAWHVWRSDDASPTATLLGEVAALEDDSRWSHASGWIYPELLLDCVVWTSSVLMHRSLIDEIGMFDTSLRIGEDYDLWLRASRATRILRVPRRMALYRAHPASITRTTPSRNYQGIVLQRALDQWGMNSPDGRQAPAGQVLRGLAQTWANFGASKLANGEVAQAWQAFRLAMKADWKLPSAWKLLAKIVLAPVLRS